MANDKNKLRYRAELDASGFEQGANRVNKAQNKVNKSGKKNAQTFTQLSYALDDAQYGFRGVQNNLQQIAVTSGASGPVVLGITALLVVINFLVERWKKAGKAGKEASEETAKALSQAQGPIAATQLYGEVLKKTEIGTDAHTYALQQLKKNGYDPAIQSLDEFIELQKSQILLNAVEKASGDKIAKIFGDIIEAREKIAKLKNASKDQDTATVGGALGSSPLLPGAGGILNDDLLAKGIKRQEDKIKEFTESIVSLTQIGAEEIEKILGKDGVLGFLNRNNKGDGGGGDGDPLAKYKKSLSGIQDANEEFGKSEFEVLKLRYERKKALAETEITDEVLKNQTILALQEEYTNQLTSLGQKQSKALLAEIDKRKAANDKYSEDRKVQAEKLGSQLQEIQRKWAELGAETQAQKLQEALDTLDDKLATGEISIEKYIAALQKLKDAFGTIDPAVLKAQQAVAALESSLNAAIAGFITDFATALGDAFNSNDENFKFGDAVLDSIGKFLVQIGTALITYGTLMGLFVALGSNPLSWPVAIGVGIAAVVVGTALSNAANKGPFNTGSGAGRSVTGGSTTTPESLQGAGGGAMRLVAEVSGESLRFVLQGADDNYNTYN